MFNFKTFKIYRGSDPSESSYKLEMADTGRTITGKLVQAGAEYSMIVDGQFGQTYIFKSDDYICDIQVGDRLKNDTESYEVRGVSSNQDAPRRNISITLTKAQT